MTEVVKVPGKRVFESVNPWTGVVYTRPEIAGDREKAKAEAVRAEEELRDGPENFDSQTRADTSSLPPLSDKFEYDEKGYLVRK